jgi:hypothetical protein
VTPRINVEDELIPARTRIPWRPVPPWAAAAAILFVLFVLVGLYSERFYDVLDFRMPYWKIVRNVYSAGLGGALLDGVPLAGALVMIWAAFARPQWSDKSLWSAAMILTTLQLTSVVKLLFWRHEPEGWGQHPYPNLLATTGIVAYASWFMIAATGTLRPLPKRIIEVLCVLAVIFCLSLPLLNSYIPPVDIVGSAIFAAACFCAGVFVAQLCGVDLFKREDEAAAKRDEQ